jgi:energy-coupling factor transport system substrate-specific component
MIRKTTLVALVTTTIAGFLWPFFAPSDSAADKASWFFLAAAPIAIALVLLLLTQQELGSKNIAFLGILTALIAAIRPLGIGAIGIEPMWFALILASRAMGPSFGFLLGSMSMLLSALLTGGIGPWLSYQIFAAALIGYLTGVIPSGLRGRSEILALALYGALAAELFGILMDLQFWPWTLGRNTQLSYQPGAPLSENLSHFFSYHFVSALAWDIPRALVTVILISITGQAVLQALRRARQKASFVSESEFKSLANV